MARRSSCASSSRSAAPMPGGARRAAHQHGAKALGAQAHAQPGERRLAGRAVGVHQHQRPGRTARRARAPSVSRTVRRTRSATRARAARPRGCGQLQRDQRDRAGASAARTPSGVLQRAHHARRIGRARGRPVSGRRACAWGRRASPRRRWGSVAMGHLSRSPQTSADGVRRLAVAVGARGGGVAGQRPRRSPPPRRPTGARPARAALRTACSGERAPTIAAVTSGRRSTQATASSATPPGRPDSRATSSSSPHHGDPLGERVVGEELAGRAPVVGARRWSRRSSCR